LTAGPEDPRTRDILDRIEDVQARLGAAQKEIRDFTYGASDEGLFPEARFPVAVFTFDDPHATGLGNDISFLLSKSMLFSAPVFSYAVVDFQTDLSEEEAGLAYFDKVDALTRGHRFVVSVWGQLSEEGSEVVIDMFAQLPGPDRESPFFRAVRLPEAMGGGVLRARIKPDRFRIQTLRMSKAAAELLRSTAEEVATLRDEPSLSARHVGEIAKGPRYVISDAQGDWVELSIEGGDRGWTSVTAFCTELCRRLIDGTGFANELVAFAAGRGSLSADPALTIEASAVAEQMRALAALDDDPARAADIARRWIDGEARPVGGALPGGAGFANLLAVARVAEALGEAGSDFDSIRLDRDFIAEVADGLAHASVADPTDLDVLENLARLFAYLGDDRRRALASSIAASVRARN
jgi:hypothetical protein